MCGVSGVWASVDNLPDKAEAFINATLASMKSRGPDSNGSLARPGVLFGHTRLAIRDLSRNGNQPMTSFSGKSIISYNGEIYNTAELTQKFPTSIKQASSDTRILIEILEAYGVENVIPHLDGMFAFGLTQLDTNCLWLCSDYYGQKPLYYSLQNEAVFFASELSGFVNSGLAEEISLDSVIEYIARGSIAAPNSLIQNVDKLPPRTMICFSGKSQRVYKYEPATTNESKLSSDDYLDMAISVFKQHCLSDVPYGLFLSSGVDSALLAGLAAEAKMKLDTYTFSFGDPAFDETEAARKIASYYGLKNTVISFNRKDILRGFQSMPHAFVEPVCDPANLPMLVMSESVSREKKVVLVGDGGDEIFNGYFGAHNEITKSYGRRSWPAFSLDVLDTLTGLIGERVLLAMKRRLVGFDPRFDTLAANYLARTMGAPFSSKCLTVNPVAYYGRAFDDFRGMSLDEIDEQLNLPSQLLPKVDRSGMAYSLEFRAPFLSTTLKQNLVNVEGFSNEERRFQKDLLRRLLPSNLFPIKKKGFAVPINDILRDVNKDYMFSLFEDDFGIINRARMEKRLSKFYAGANDAAWIFQMTCLFSSLKKVTGKL